MTANQTRAIELARAIIEGRLRARDLPDRDWSLLLLAAGMGCSTSLPIVVCAEVLDQAQKGIGYFAGARQSMGEPSAVGGDVEWSGPGSLCEIST